MTLRAALTLQIVDLILWNGFFSGALEMVHDIRLLCWPLFSYCEDQKPKSPPLSGPLAVGGCAGILNTVFRGKANYPLNKSQGSSHLE